MNYEINNRITQIFFSRSLICLSYTVYLVYNSYDLIHFVVLIIMSNLIVFMFNVSTGMPFKSYLSTLLHTHTECLSPSSLFLCADKNRKLTLNLVSNCSLSRRVLSSWCSFSLLSKQKKMSCMIPFLTLQLSQPNNR